jgi:hypothetical protein
MATGTRTKRITTKILADPDKGALRASATPPCGVSDSRVLEREIRERRNGSAQGHETPAKFM